MDVANELSEFLTSRRAKVTPEQTGLPRYGQRRSMAGRNPYVRALSDLVGTKRLDHPVVGDLELSYEVMELAADAGLRLGFTAEPASRSEEALNLLASWAAAPVVATVEKEQP